MEGMRYVDAEWSGCVSDADAVMVGDVDVDCVGLSNADAETLSGL